MKAKSYIVGYRDSAAEPILYFGPFVSEHVADFFIAALPAPLEGGWTRTVTLQPFLSHEARTVAQIILRNREPRPVNGRHFA